MDLGRVRAWIESIAAAIAEVKRLGGVSRLALFGVRLGATLAAQAASECGGVESLVMWAPCVTGRAFARELRASRSKLLAAEDATIGSGLEALGYVYTAQTLQDIQTLDCQKLNKAPAKRVMIVGRDDMPAEEPLTAAFSKLGIDTIYSVLPGYAKMMVESHEGVVTHTTLDSMVDWLGSAPHVSNAQVGRADMPLTEAVTQVDSVFDGVREVPLIFGAENNLFGILSEPEQLLSSDVRGETAVLMLNVGTNHRIGPNRMYVKMARSWTACGYRTLRFDLAGIGDSRSAAGYSSNRLYSKGSTVDVQSAIDCLVTRGCKKFILMGLCSGAYVAFQTALVDTRVTGLVLMNPRRLEWLEGETLQTAMQMSYKSTHFYKTALFDPKIYVRLVRGDVDVKGIVGRMAVLVKARLKRSMNRILHHTNSGDDVLANAQQLSAQGVDTLMVIGAEDDGRDYIEFHLGRRGSHMHDRANFRMTFIEGSDHTFSNEASQQLVIATVQKHLDQLALAVHV